MKHLLNLYECILIVVLIAVLLLSEIVYMSMLRAKDKVVEIYMEVIQIDKYKRIN